MEGVIHHVVVHNQPVFRVAQPHARVDPLRLEGLAIDLESHAHPSHGHPPHVVFHSAHAHGMGKHKLTGAFRLGQRGNGDQTLGQGQRRNGSRVVQAGQGLGTCCKGSHRPVAAASVRQV